MRRPIVPVCGGFVSGTVSAYLIMMKYGAAENFAVFAITAVAIAVALSLLLTEKSIAERMLYDCSKCRIKSSETCLLFMLAFILSSVLMYAETAKTDSMAEKAGSVYDINGTVLFAEEKERGEKYRLIIRSGTGEKILVTAAGKNETIPNSICRQFNYREIVGCCVSMRTYIELPQGKRNPKCFDYRLYLRSRGVQTAANVSIAQISIEERPQSLYTKWLHAISVFKGDFYEKLLLYTDEESAAMMMGMLFGEKNLIDGDIKELYQKNGTAHVLAVSGLHTGALYACVSKLMRKKRSVTGNMLTAMLFMTYTAMAGFSPSVMRASGMILIHIFADMRHRRYDMLSAACLCAIISILRNPFSVFDTGFQLSYTAIVTIAIAASALRYLPYGKLISLFSVQFGTLPITVYIFNYFSIGSFAANIPVIFIAGLTVPAGMAAFVLCNINNVLFSIASRTAVMLCEFMTFINELTYAGGRLTFDAVSPSLFF
ncbi:MAG: ComEC/Rec2 family competence protein, partial [Firmicutes bacterium]|nr:ComEC/Rec2 family competence protein [Bacillota bacterium]